MTKQNTCGHETARSYRNGRVRCLACGKRMTMAQWEAVIIQAERAEDAKRAAKAAAVPVNVAQRIYRALGLHI